MIKAEKVFKEQYGDSKNPFTPNIIKYYLIKDGACELSHGKFGYGISVVKNNKRRNDLSKLVSTKKEATEYIKDLKNKQYG